MRGYLRERNAPICSLFVAVLAIRLSRVEIVVEDVVGLGGICLSALVDGDREANGQNDEEDEEERVHYYNPDDDHSRGLGAVVGNVDFLGRCVCVNRVLESNEIP